MTTARQGSAFLLCLALAAFAAMVGYAFLRSAARQTMSGKSELLVALAQDAAQSGLSHATEQILVDYNSRSLELATGGGAVTVSPVPMHLDGPYRAPFVSLQSPNRLAYANVVEGDDVGEENHLMKHSIRKGEFSYAWWHDYQGGYTNQGGGMIYDARGRFIELNYYNITRPTPTAANPVPVAVTRFKDPNAAKPERSDGLFFDENLRRLTSGTVEDQRRKARYRVRYAVGVEDLNAHILSNPRADMNIDWTDANNDYRQVPRWVDHAGYVLENMVSPWANSRAAAMRFGHLFRGRGNASNCDRAWVAGSRNGLPATFPMMYRQGQRTTDDQPWFGVFNFDNDGSPRMGGAIFGFDNSKYPSYPAIVANPAGGEILTPVGQNIYRPYAHALVGPQLSWLNQVFAMQGAFYPMENYQDGKSVDYGNWSSQWSYFNSVYTPFGRSQQATAKPLANRKWYEGNLDHPWMINLLTAPPQVISEMLLGYIPPHLKTLHYTRDYYYKRIGTMPPPDNRPIYDTKPDTKRGVVPDPVGAPTVGLGYTYNGTHWDPVLGKDVENGWDYSMRGLDVINEHVGAGFSEFPAPANAVTGVKPDYYQPTDPRTFEQFYPGALARGDSTKPEQGQDDFGRHIDVDTAMLQGIQVGWCTHTYNPLLFFAGGDLTRTDNGPDLDGKPGEWKIVRVIDPLMTKAKHSYFWDLIYAMTTTCSYVKGTWVQYPNGMFDPRPGASQLGFLDPALRNPTAYDTIEEIDALFLRQLGEDFANPGKPNPTLPIVSNWAKEWAKSDKIQFKASTQAVAFTIGKLVGEDKNGNGVVDAGEDADGDGKLDESEDKDHDHHLDDVNEDKNGNGLLDPAEDKNGNGLLDPAEDANGNGTIDPGEDANGNGKLDPKEDIDGDGVMDPDEDLDGDGHLDDGTEDQNNNSKLDSLIATFGGVNGAERGKVMERMLNDWRMSFFGASPTYVDFRPLDFDGNGKVHCSCYDRNPGASMEEKSKYQTDRWEFVDAGAGLPGRGPKPKYWFSITGSFYIGKSHYFRVFTRGEVYDNLLKKPVAQQELESVMVVDPEAPLFPPAGRISTEQRLLYKRWHHNDSVSELPLQMR